MIYTSAYDSPVGPLLLISDGEALLGIHLPDEAHPPTPSPDWTQRDRAKPFPQAREQLGRYFRGARRSFDLPLAPQGTDFQRRVWQELLRIPYGQTISYGELARRIGKPGAARAVGLANGRNPLAIVIPCHRVIGADGSLTGYGGGLLCKQALLELEGATTAGSTVTNPIASVARPRRGTRAATARSPRALSSGRRR